MTQSKTTVTSLNPFMQEMRVKATLIQPLLGGSPSPDVYLKHLSHLAPDAPTKKEEVEALGVDEVAARGTTVFPKVNDTPVMWDYQMKGMFKSIASALRRMEGPETNKLTAHRQIIATSIMVMPRAIPLMAPPGEDLTVQTFDTAHPQIFDDALPRALRAETPKGPRVALANSEVLPRGTTFEFRIQFPKKLKGSKKNNPDLAVCIREWLDYAALHGTGQWRNAGFGRFTWEEITD